MKANSYDVLDTFTKEIIIKQKRVSDIAEELQVEGKKVSQAAQYGGLIKKRYQIICDKQYDFTFIDEDGIRKTFSQEWEKVIKNLSRVEKGRLQKIPITGRD